MLYQPIAGVEQRGIFAVIGVGPLVVIAVLVEIFLRDKPVELGNIRVVFVEHDVERAVHPALEFNPVLVAVGLNLDFALDGRLDALGLALGHRQFDAGRVVLQLSVDCLQFGLLGCLVVLQRGDLVFAVGAVVQRLDARPERFDVLRLVVQLGRDFGDGIVGTDL